MNTVTAQPAWRDSKRYWWLLSPMVPGIGILAGIAFLLTGEGLFLWTGPILIYGIIPLLDWLIGEDSSNPPESAVMQLEDDRYYRAIVFSYVPLQYIMTLAGAWLYVTFDLETWVIVGLVLSIGAINGIGINTAHELSHKREEFERWLSKITLAPVAYGHFYTEHVRGHHKNVATPDDPASSKMGESFWRFLPRTVIGSAISGWKIEKERLARKGLPVWTWQNDNLQAWAMTVVLFAAITTVLGWKALPFLLLQAAYGASLLEVINYIEHYGLLRQKDANGRYERVTPQHSWNSNHVVTNVFLYQLQRHSDHHANPARRFQALRHFDDSPQLPSGYASMLVPAYIPWLWFRQMDPLVIEHYKGDLTKANLLPSKREKLLQRLARKQQPDLVIHAPAKTAAGTGGAPLASGFARYRCTDCGFVYDEQEGCEREGFAPGTRWENIPDSWSCPDCAVRDKVDFERIG
ncbi:MAG: fatty acid desaturase [Pseudomonadota bacterium]